MAELEAEAGARATYFLMTRSVFYNLARPTGERAVARLRELGHASASTPSTRASTSTTASIAVLAWHNPEPEYMREPIDGASNVMRRRWFAPGHYRSDSNQHWRSGCPHDELRAGAFEWLQLLVHPEIWVVRGRDDARDDALDARRRARARGSSSSPRTGST